MIRQFPIFAVLALPAGASGGRNETVSKAVNPATLAGDMAYSVETLPGLAVFAYP